MLYHFANIDVFELVTAYASIFSKKDIILLDNSILPTVNLNEECNSFIAIKKFSKITQTTIFLSTKLKDQKVAIVIDVGRIIGITTQINCNKEYLKGNSLDLYLIYNKSILLILNEDIFLENLHNYIISFKPTHIFHMDDAFFNQAKCSIASALSVNNRINVYSLFNDMAINYDKSGAFKRIEVGKFRRLPYFKTS